MLNPTPSVNDNYLWIPEGITDNVVPGLDSILIYTQSKYVTRTSLQNKITNINSYIQTEIINLEIPNQGVVNVNEELYYHHKYTYYMFQRNHTIHKYDNRRMLITINHHVTYQRKSKHELEVQLLNMIAIYLQTKLTILRIITVTLLLIKETLNPKSEL